jgi:hypothetical protein
MKKISTSKLRTGYNRGRKSDKTRGKQNKSDKPEKVQENINKRIGKQPKSKPVPKTTKANKSKQIEKVAKVIKTDIKPVKPILKPEIKANQPNKTKVEGKTLRRNKLNLYQQKYYYKKRLDAGKITEKQFNKIVSDIDKNKLVIDKTFGISSGFSPEGKYHRKRCVTVTKKVITETIKGKKVKRVVKETHLTDEYKRADKALYMKIYRRKKKIAEITKDKNWKKKRGNKSKRSELYKEIISINEERRLLRRECDRQEPTIPDKTKLETTDEEENIEYIRGRGVWQFEKDLNDYLTSESYKYVDMGNFGKFKISPANNMKILRAYDEYRDFVYLDPFATSPIVNVMIDYNTMTIFIEILG